MLSMSVACMILFGNFNLRPPTLVPLPLILPKTERFVGGLLGVSAKVDLCHLKEYAFISISGIPIGGTISGTASFSHGEGSRVVINEPLKTSLRRRMVSIVDARFDRRADVVYVEVHLPFLIGTKTIKLERENLQPNFTNQIKCV